MSEEAMETKTVDSSTHFSREELTCHCGCGRCEMDAVFMARLEALREAFGKPMKLSSAYRCPDYNAAVSTTGPNGPHTTGRAVDVLVSGEDAWRLVQLAYDMGFTGLGVCQRGPHETRFIHLDDLEDDVIRPRIWSY